MSDTRAEIVELLREHRERMQQNLPDFWRRNAEDMLKAGLDRGEVIESMLIVAVTQGVKALGCTPMAEHLQRMVGKLEEVAATGAEFPIKEPTLN